MSSDRNRIRTYLLALSLALAHAGAASGVTLSAEDAGGAPGSTVTVALSLENDVAVRAVQLRLADTPDELSLVPGSARTTARSAALVADANEQEDGSVIAVLISTGAALIAAGSGPVMEMDFTIAPSASVGTTITLGLSEVLVADEDRAPLPAETQDGGVLVALVTPTPTQTADGGPTQTSTAAPTATATRTAGCVGDCDVDGRVTVSELIKGVNITLGNALLTTCPAFDTNASETVTVDELVAAVNMALNGCGS